MDVALEIGIIAHFPGFYFENKTGNTGVIMADSYAHLPSEGQPEACFRKSPSGFFLCCF